MLFLIVCAAVGWMALTAPTRPRVAQPLSGAAAFLLVNKVWSPQYSLWLVPLAVLAIPRWKIHCSRGWLLDALVWVPRMMYYLGLDHKGLPVEWFLGTVDPRDVVVIALCALVVYEIYQPRA